MIMGKIVFLLALMIASSFHGKKSEYLLVKLDSQMDFVVPKATGSIPEVSVPTGNSQNSTKLPIPNAVKGTKDCKGKRCGEDCQHPQSSEGVFVCNKQERCVGIEENPCSVHGCKGKKCGENCLMGDIMGYCDANGDCKFSKSDCGLPNNECPKFNPPGCRGGNGCKDGEVCCTCAPCRRGDMCFKTSCPGIGDREVSEKCYKNKNTTQDSGCKRDDDCTSMQFCDRTGTCKNGAQEGQVCNEMWGPRCVEGLKCEGKAVAVDGNGICRGNQITCGNKCTTATVDTDCQEGQRCRLAKDECHMTCEDVPQECPKESPTGKCIGNKRCEYGEECCCGKCHPSFVSTCLFGQWLSLYTDACRNAHLVCEEGTKLEGETCGPCFNFVGTCGTCVEGLECVPHKMVDLIPDLPSRCTAPQSKIKTRF